MASTGAVVPRWIEDVFRYLASLPGLEVSLRRVDAAEAPVPRRAGPLGELWCAYSRRQFDPYATAPANTTAGLDDCDLVVWLAPGKPIDVAVPYGFLTIRLGDRDLEPPYSGEVLHGDLVSRVTLLWQDQSSSPPRAIRTAELQTQRRLAFTRTARGCLEAAGQLIAEAALDIRADFPEWAARAATAPSHPGEPLRRPVRNLECGRFIIRHLGQVLRKELKKDSRPAWFCALRNNRDRFYSRSGRFEPSQFHEIPQRGSTEMADPFLVSDGGRNWLFFEEILSRPRKGRLCCMEILPGGRSFGKPEVVLESDTHLSYPCVFSDRGEYFMIPETSASRDVRLYRATRFPHEWQMETLLLQDVAVTDTTPFFHDGRWYFFTTTMVPFRETVLLTAEALGSPLRLHRSSPISCSVHNTRAAGHLFQWNGRLFRPTQDCSVRYGYGIYVNEVTQFSRSQFTEERYDFFGPDWAPGLTGTHTLNANAEFEVIDGSRPRT